MDDDGSCGDDDAARHDSERTTQRSRTSWQQKEQAQNNRLVGYTRSYGGGTCKAEAKAEWLAAAGGTGRLLAGQRERDLGLGLPWLGLDGIGPETM